MNTLPTGTLAPVSMQVVNTMEARQRWRIALVSMLLVIASINLLICLVSDMLDYKMFEKG